MVSDYKIGDRVITKKSFPHEKSYGTIHKIVYWNKSNGLLTEELSDNCEVHYYGIISDNRWTHNIFPSQGEEIELDLQFIRDDKINNVLK